MPIVEGGCHCGLVRYAVTVPDGPVDVLDCDCSICAMTGYLHVIVPEARFRLLEGAREVTSYRFGTGRAQHVFCSQCGIKSWYRPRSHPGHISVNLRCLDEGHGLETRIVAFDGVYPA
ncbi:GFA family protein [Sphingomonas quercus]|uniref:GFA family protein n=1 Tax=Sphingomonas quercus TaxID=2842451 RepID=A0ABS6BDS7_9SPHN|nr:GFA family protein [Sphingomonas quercus]MBU3076473.1 GFA family protein [Sphingomonas quercus]